MNEESSSATAAAKAALVESISPQAHSRIFRGKNLGSTVTDEQKAAIRDGSFKDLFLGDYWVINNITWRIVDMNYWYNTHTADDEYFKSHHLVIMPDTCIGSAKMKNDGTTTGGYVGSDMYKTGLSSAKTAITNAFGNLVLTHGEYLVNAVSNGKPSGAILKASTVELPSEIMMYGTNIYSPGNDGITVPALRTYCKTQLALFNVAPRYIVVEGTYYWLRDVVSSDSFARVSNNGCAHKRAANYPCRVRPYFCIG